MAHHLSHFTIRGRTDGLLPFGVQVLWHNTKLTSLTNYLVQIGHQEVVIQETRTQIKLQLVLLAAYYCLEGNTGVLLLGGSSTKPSVGVLVSWICRALVLTCDTKIAFSTGQH